MLAGIPVEVGLPGLGNLVPATVFSEVRTLLAYRRTAQKNACLLA